jgi:hypothetical protein
MALKVKAVEKKLLFEKDGTPIYRYVMSPDDGTVEDNENDLTPNPSPNGEGSENQNGGGTNGGDNNGGGGGDNGLLNEG